MGDNCRLATSSGTKVHDVMQLGNPNNPASSRSSSRLHLDLCNDAGQNHGPAAYLSQYLSLRSYTHSLIHTHPVTSHHTRINIPSSPRTTFPTPTSTLSRAHPSFFQTISAQVIIRTRGRGYLRRRVHTSCAIFPHRRHPIRVPRVCSARTR